MGVRKKYRIEETNRAKRVFEGFRFGEPIIGYEAILINEKSSEIFKSEKIVSKKGDLYKGVSGTYYKVELIK